jgi:glycosyltransferase involved in cell wall biosynthesis
MNILLINHYAGTPELGMEFRPYYLAREWIKAGNRVTIVAASFAHVRNKQPVVDVSFSEELIDDIRYVWLRTPAYKGNGARRILNMCVFVTTLFSQSKQVAARYTPDVVIASSTYPLDIYPARRIASFSRAKLVYEVHDLWPLSPIELGGMSPRHPFIMVIQAAEDYAYRVSDKVVSMLPMAKPHMVKHGMNPDKFSYVPNGIVIEEWLLNRSTLPSEHTATIENLRAKCKFIVGYAGAHGLANALQHLIRAASKLEAQSIGIILVGDGAEKDDLVKMTSDMKLRNVVFLPPVPKAMIPELLSRMDALYIGLSRCSLFRFGISPNKLMDYMMAGKPVIYAIEAGNNMIAEAGCGLSVPVESSDAIVEAATKLAAMHKDALDSMGKKGRDYVIAHHDYRVLAKKFLESLIV